MVVASYENRPASLTLVGDPTMSHHYLCAKDVANILGVSQTTASRLMRTNEFSSCKVGPRLLTGRLL